MNEKGKECKTRNEYWGGPFFDNEGEFYKKVAFGKYLTRY